MTPADLHRWYCGPWCPKCELIGQCSCAAQLVASRLADPNSDALLAGEDFPQSAILNYARHRPWLMPGLHTRWPETKPEGLEWRESQLPGRLLWCLDNKFWISPATAAALCLAGVVEAMADLTEVDFELGSGNGCFYVNTIEAGETSAPTIHEAAAIAAHRYRDSLEANG